jgi:outer membrane protein assembly factor BamA
LAAVAVLFSAALPTAAQKFQPQKILFQGAPEYSNQELMVAAGLQKGATLAFADMKEHSKMLLDTGIFENVSFKFDGVDLTYTVVPAENLFAVRVENLPLPSGADLDAALHNRLPLYHGKVPSEGKLTEAVSHALEQMLADKGIKVDVVVLPYTDQKLRKVTAMSFSIIALPVRVGAIHFEKPPSPALQAQLKLVTDHESGTAFGSQDSATSIERAIELFYTDEGYAAVKVHAAPSGDPLVTEAAIDVPFAVTIDEGRRYKLGSIHLPPNLLVPQAEIDKIATASASRSNGQTLRDAWFLIASRYKARGYLDVAVTPHPELDEATGTVNYTVEVNPGPVFHLAFVKFLNVSDELRSHLMRVWQMMPGAPFDESYLSGFMVQAQKDDPVLMRSLSGVGASYENAVNHQTHEVNCVIHFKKLQPNP